MSKTFTTLLYFRDKSDKLERENQTLKEQLEQIENILNSNIFYIIYYKIKLFFTFSEQSL